MFRLISGELSNFERDLIGPQIEVLSRRLCELPVDEIDNFDLSSLKSLCSMRLDGNFYEQTTNILSVSCPICGGNFPRAQMETMFFCNHSCCRDCTKNYYRAILPNIGNVTALGRLTCFQEEHQLTDDQSSIFFAWITSKVRSRHSMNHKYFSRSFRLSADGLVEKSFH